MSKLKTRKRNEYSSTSNDGEVIDLVDSPQSNSEVFSDNAKKRSSKHTLPDSISNGRRKLNDGSDSYLPKGDLVVIDNQWACGVCTLLNKDEHLACSACGSERGADKENAGTKATKATASPKENAVKKEALAESKSHVGLPRVSFSPPSATKATASPKENVVKKEASASSATPLIKKEATESSARIPVCTTLSFYMMVLLFLSSISIAESLL